MNKQIFPEERQSSSCYLWSELLQLVRYEMSMCFRLTSHLSELLVIGVETSHTEVSCFYLKERTSAIWLITTAHVHSRHEELWLFLYLIDWCLGFIPLRFISFCGTEGAVSQQYYNILYYCVQSFHHTVPIGVTPVGNKALIVPLWASCFHLLQGLQMNRTPCLYKTLPAPQPISQWSHLFVLDSLP